MSCTEKSKVVIPALRQRGNATTPNVPLYGIPYSGTFIGYPVLLDSH
ncbi:MAG: hypothetical protein WAV76_04480 [Bacteroidota bacterium]